MSANGFIYRAAVSHMVPNTDLPPKGMTHWENNMNGEREGAERPRAGVGAIIFVIDFILACEYSTIQSLLQLSHVRGALTCVNIRERRIEAISLV